MRYDGDGTPKLAAHHRQSFNSCRRCREVLPCDFVLYCYEIRNTGILLLTALRSRGEYLDSPPVMS